MCCIRPKLLIQMFAELLQLNWHPLLLGCLADLIATDLCEITAKSEGAMLRRARAAGWRRWAVSLGIGVSQPGLALSRREPQQGRWEAQPRSGAHLKCSEAFGTLALSFPLLGHVLCMSAVPLDNKCHCFVNVGKFRSPFPP